MQHPLTNWFENMAKLAKIVLGFDFGMKKIGIAIGQTLTETARPLITLPAKSGEPDWLALTKIIKKWVPQLLIVGIPLNMDGTEQLLTHAARHFALALTKHYQLPIIEMDERLTTQDAKERLFNQGGYKALQGGQIDQVAAQLIIQNWFAEIKKNEN
jgi:putative Holliday junction resolvase